jgi:hypothetical protein
MKSGTKFYLYRGVSFEDPIGYKLIMMAQHFMTNEGEEIRFYTNNDIDTSKFPNLSWFISSKFKLGK